MFNHSLKKNALAIHANALERYKETYNEKIQLMEERWATDMNL